MSEKLKVVLLDRDTLGPDSDVSIFREFGEFTSYGITRYKERAERAKDADIIITNKVLMDRELLSGSKIKLIALTATGMNNVDLEAAKELGIVVKNVAGYSTNSVAQQCFANLLALLNHTAYYNEYCTSKNGWAGSELFAHLNLPIRELAGKSFCVVGLGDIGKAVAKIAAAFGCEVCYYSTSGKNDNKEWRQVDFETALKCDIISIHAPLNEKTKGLFGVKEIAKLKTGAILSNCGRGGIVDEQAIADEIDRREIYFASDVLEREPMREDHPFLKVIRKDRLSLSPHIAWASVEARKTLMELVAQNIRTFIKERK